MKRNFKLFRIAPFSFFLYCRYSLYFVDSSPTTVLLTINKDRETKILGIRRYNKTLQWQTVISTDLKVD